MPPQLGGTGTTWRLSNHTGERVLDTLTTVEVALRGVIEQTVAVVEACTSYACDFYLHECHYRREGYRFTVVCLSVC